MTDHDLVAGVVAGDPRALAAFDQRFGGDLRNIAARTGHGTDVDELVQRLRVRILVGTAAAPPKLASWRGQGSLAAWVRAVAARFVIDQRRHLQARPAPDRLVQDDLVQSAHLDGALAHDRYAAIVRTCVEEAFAVLTPRERNLLRWAVFHGLGVDALGRMYRVHRATAARWLARTRESLHATVTERVRAATGVSEPEAHSLVRALGEHVDVSLRSVLSMGLEREAFASGPPG